MNDVMLKIRIEQAKEQVCQFCQRYEDKIEKDILFCYILEGKVGFTKICWVLEHKGYKDNDDVYKKYFGLLNSFRCTDFRPRKDKE